MFKTILTLRIIINKIKSKVNYIRKGECHCEHEKSDKFIHIGSIHGAPRRL